VVWSRQRRTAALFAFAGMWDDFNGDRGTKSNRCRAASGSLFSDDARMPPGGGGSDPSRAMPVSWPPTRSETFGSRTGDEAKACHDRADDALSIGAWGRQGIARRQHDHDGPPVIVCP